MPAVMKKQFALYLAAILTCAAVFPVHPVVAVEFTPTEHAVSRVCVSERTFAVLTDDCGMIVDVLQTQAAMRGQTVLQRAQRYASHTSPGTARRQRHWVQNLRTDGERPATWPRGIPWDRPRRNGAIAREQWMLTLYEVRARLAGRELSPCTEPVFHWGGPVVDRARIERGIARGAWHRVDCGDTLNVPLGPGPTVAVPQDPNAS